MTGQVRERHLATTEIHSAEFDEYRTGSSEWGRHIRLIALQRDWGRRFLTLEVVWRLKVMWKSREGNVEVAWRSCKGRAKVVQRSCKGRVKVVRRSHESHVKVVWRSYEGRGYLEDAVAGLQRAAAARGTRLEDVLDEDSRDRVRNVDVRRRNVAAAPCRQQTPQH